MAGAECGGAETMYADGVLALAGAGTDQLLLTRPSRLRDSLWVRHGLAVRHASFPRPWMGRSTRKAIRQAIADFKPDLCHYWMARAASYAAADSGIPNIGWFGAPSPLDYYRHCQFFIGLTQELVRHIVAGGARPEAAVCIHPFADLPAGPPADRAALDTPAGVPVLLSLSRLHWHKAIDVLLRAMPQLPEAYLWIAGEGPAQKSLQALAASLGIEARVRWLGWRTDRGALLAASTLCVFPSRVEPFGNVMVEAWAAGVPLIAAAAQGPKAYCRHEFNGLLVEPDDVPGLAAAIRRCLAEPDLCRRLTENGRRCYETSFTKDVFVRDMTAFYRMVREAGGPGCASAGRSRACPGK